MDAIYESTISAKNEIIDYLKAYESEVSEPKASRHKVSGDKKTISKRIETERITSEELRLAGDTLLAKVKALLRQGNFFRIKIQNQEGHTLVTIPLAKGVIRDGDVITDSPEIISVGIVGDIVACPIMVIEWQISCPISGEYLSDECSSDKEPNP